MRKSKVLSKLRNGEVATCFKVNLKDAQATEISAIMGFDCVWVDQEHIGQDWSTIASHVWASKAHDTDLMVRVSRGSYSDYIRPLELDATGILVPHVMNLEDAKRVIHMTRFHPIGRRPIDGGNADAQYTAMDFGDYLQHASEQRFIALQIEDPEPLDDLEEIAQLEGFDMLFFGPGDFSQGIGAPGDFNHPRLVDARRRVADVANKYGKFAATVGTPASIDSLLEMGYHFVSMGADVIALKDYCREILKSFPSASAERNGSSYLEK